MGERDFLWFPNLYENNHWKNEISLDENEIHEMNKKDQNKYFEWAKVKPNQFKECLVFARVRSNLGDVMYRFKGAYKLDLDGYSADLEKGMKLVYKRIAKSAKTYSPLK